VRVTLDQRGSTGLFFSPGLARPFILDTSSLSTPEAEAFADMIRQARFYEYPAHPAGISTKGADRALYQIAVEEEGRQHTIVVTDPIPPVLSPLITYLVGKRNDSLRKHSSPK
jgi:hypothetical protein